MKAIVWLAGVVLIASIAYWMLVQGCSTFSVRVFGHTIQLSTFVFGAVVYAGATLLTGHALSGKGRVVSAKDYPVAYFCSLFSAILIVAFALVAAHYGPSILNDPRH
jgi:hypothetical protein